MAYTLYHNPRCSKSRQTLELLTQHNVDLTVVEYLKTPPSIADITQILKLLELEPRELIRKGEEEYKVQNLSNTALSQEQLIEAMHNSPKLIERPILVTPKSARIGRPPESVLEII